MAHQEKKSGVVVPVVILAAAAAVLIPAFVFVGVWMRRLPGDLPERTSVRDSRETAAVPEEIGRIFLYGEEHGSAKIMEREAELWNRYYQEEGMRDLFVELPFYTAEFLNLWMREDGDETLDALYAEWEGTALHVEEVKDFYRQIKRECPETVFHGTDVGHQYETTGKRYLEYLESAGQESSEAYAKAQETMEQGRYYYRHGDNPYRENAMTENFLRELRGLEGKNVMGIYGSAHTNPEAMEYSEGTVPCMAGQLRVFCGDLLYSVDLTLSVRDMEALRVDTIEVCGQTYKASYFGQADLTWFSEEMQYREFWRLEGAYDDLKERETTGNVLPYDNYPMAVEVGEVFVIDYTMADGSVRREYHRADGGTWQGKPATVEFQAD